jgi:hypothetical protein
MTQFTAKKLNRFLALKLPSAYFSGIRVKGMSENEAMAAVRHQWINQNPFKSLYWATQGMAAELVTGLLVMKKIRESKKKFSMLVVHQEGSFFKKATGVITFSCDEGQLVDKALETAEKTGEGQTFKLSAEGFNEDYESVSKFEFTWSVKLKTK